MKLSAAPGRRRLEFKLLRSRAEYNIPRSPGVGVNELNRCLLRLEPFARPAIIPGFVRFAHGPETSGSQHGLFGNDTRCKKLGARCNKRLGARFE